MVSLMAGIYACVKQDRLVKFDNTSSVYDVHTEIRNVPCDDRLVNCFGGAWTTVITNVSVDLCSNQAPILPCSMNTIGSTGCIPNCYLL